MAVGLVRSGTVPLFHPATLSSLEGVEAMRIGFRYNRLSLRLACQGWARNNNLIIPHIVAIDED